MHEWCHRHYNVVTVDTDTLYKWLVQMRGNGSGGHRDRGRNHCLLGGCHHATWWIVASSIVCMPLWACRQVWRPPLDVKSSHSAGLCLAIHTRSVASAEFGVFQACLRRHQMQVSRQWSGCAEANRVWGEARSKWHVHARWKISPPIVSPPGPAVMEVMCGVAQWYQRQKSRNIWQCTSCCGVD